MEKEVQTIMVVEDNESDVDALVACLGKDYRVKVAMDGTGALEDIRTDMPDLVLLDILMPGMDGFEVCRQIKQDPAIRDVQVIFVTALTETVDETRGLEMGAIDYITKPFNFAVIRAKIKTHLDLALARKELEYQNRILKENIKLREQVEQVYRHDLKTPIQAVLAAAQLMKGRDLGQERQDKLLQEQINACYTMVDMINRTMVLYKMEKGACPLTIQPVDIMPLLDRIAIGFSSYFRSRNIRLDIELNGNPAKAGVSHLIPCDEMLFYVMMSNLIKNALDASPDNAAIRIGVSEDQDSVAIEIENQGAVPESIRPCFFEKFVTHGKLDGTGLGTYSARLTTKLHGGTIGFEVPENEDRTIVRVKIPK